MVFQLTPGTGAPAELNIHFPDHAAPCLAENATPDRPKGQGRAEISGNPDTPAELFTHLTTPDPDFTIVTP